jgi:EipB-like
MRGRLSQRSIAMIAFVCICASATGCAQAQERATTLAAHRAVYDFSLAKKQDHSSVIAVSGRMVYELTGSTCEGYTEKVRFVTEMTSADGEETVSDQWTSTWEEGKGKRFRFNTTETRDGTAIEDTAGDATRGSTVDKIAVALTKPTKKDLTLAAGVYFPAQHTIALLTAARTGQVSLGASVYDGTESGEKVYHTVSGIAVLPAKDANRQLESLENADRLRRLPAWRIRVAYFDPKSNAEDAAPTYEIRSVLFENGVNSQIIMDYGGFAIEGDLKKIDFLESDRCR